MYRVGLPAGRHFVNLTMAPKNVLRINAAYFPWLRFHVFFEAMAPNTTFWQRHVNVRLRRPVNGNDSQLIGNPLFYL